MFGWLFGKKQTPDEFDLYSPKLRRIFRYFDGAAVIARDPMSLFKNVMAVGPELDADMKIANSTMKGNLEAHGEMVNKIRDIFAVKKLEDGGLGDLECVELLSKFLSYVATLKKNSSPLPTFSKATLASSKTSAGEDQPIKSSSVSGSAKKESSINVPTPSPSEQESPSVPSNRGWTTVEP